MGTPTIRLATHQDISDLIPLYAEFHDFHVAGVPDRLSRPDAYDEAALQAALHAILQRGDAAIFVAESGGKLIGLAEVYLRQDEPHPLTIPHRYGLLQSLIVSAPFRKSGVGRLLVEAAHRWTKEQRATEMQLDIWEFAEGPLHFYEKSGYRTLKRHMVIDLS
jgi:GNAT superfamily N-acetyltransferase